MRKLILIATVMLGIPGVAAANCGPRLDFDISQSERFSDSMSGPEGYQYNNRNDGYDERVGIRLSIPLGKNYCAERERNAARESELRQLKELLKLCKTYPDSQLLEGKCK